MILQELERPIIIAGPCAAESRDQVLCTAEQVAEREIWGRASLYKPRTEPSYLGVGGRGTKWLAEAMQGEVVDGITIRKPALLGSEVMLPEHLKSLVRGVRLRSAESLVLAWLGSRNQNDRIQRQMGRILVRDERILLGIKNPPWKGKSGEKHWIGASKHVLAGGAKPEQIFLIHRGFDIDDGSDMRNPADLELAMRVKEATGLPMLIDPSHIGGTTKEVKNVAREAAAFERRGQKFDGYMFEVHPNPNKALTDKGQQLTWEEFDKLMEEIGVKLPIRRAA